MTVSNFSVREPLPIQTFLARETWSKKQTPTDGIATR